MSLSRHHNPNNRYSELVSVTRYGIVFIRSKHTVEITLSTIQHDYRVNAERSREVTVSKQARELGWESETAIFRPLLYSKPQGQREDSAETTV